MTTSVENKILPHSYEAEKAIIGAILEKPKAIEKVMEGLKIKDFYGVSAKDIYKSMIELYRKDIEIDVISLKESLEQSDKENFSAKELLRDILENYIAIGNLDNHISTVKNKSLLRSLAILVDLNEDKIYEKGMMFNDLFRNFESSFIELGELVKNEKPVDPEGILEEVKKDIRKAEAQGWFGFSTGFSNLDKNTGGMMLGHVWVIGAYCMGKGTKIITYNGEKKNIEDIEVGDLLASVNSKEPRRVQQITSGIDYMYEISGKYIDKFTVNGNHILPMMWVGDGYKKERGKIEKIKVDEFIQKSNREKRGYRLLKSSAQYKENSIPIDPWLLGFWLGDGRKRGTSFAVSNKKVWLIDELKKYAIQYGLKFSANDWKNDGVLDVYLGAKLERNRLGQFKNGNKLFAKLNTLGVINNKHIPDCYKYTITKNRLELLAGLVDSDGSITGASKSVVNFHQVDKKLITQVRELAESLGFNTHLKKCEQRGGQSSISTKGKGYIWRLSITGNIELIPLKDLSKKIQNGKFVKKYYSDKLGVTFNVKPIGLDEYYGVTLDGNHLYLAQNNIVNHNTGTGKTWLILQILLNLLRINVKVMLFSSEMDRKMNMVRMLANITETNPLAILKGGLNPEIQEKQAVAEKELKTYQHRLFIYDFVYWVEDIRLKIKKAKIKHGVQVVFIDFIQNLRTKTGGTLYERMSSISMELQKIAQELNVCIVINSQVNQASAGSVDSYGAISYKGAGEIAAVADVGLWLKTSKKLPRNYRYLMIRKARHGIPGKFIVSLEYPSGRMIEIAQDQSEQSETQNIANSKKLEDGTDGVNF